MSVSRITPYDFQLEAAAALIASEGNPLAVLATGLGKSVIIGETCRRLDATTLTIVPTQELCEQNEQAVRAVWPLADVGILCGGLKRRDHRAKNLIATIQSVHVLKRQGVLLDIIGAREVVIVDEAHRVRADRLGMIHETIGVLKPWKVMGLTATDYRLDSGRLVQDGADGLFDRIVYQMGLADGIDWRGGGGERLLLPLVAKKTAAAIDVAGVKIRAGDFAENELATRANIPELVAAAADEIIRYSAGRKRWLAFCCGCDHAHDVAAALSERGVIAQAVTFRTKPEMRSAAIAAFRRGDITCLTGMNVFTTGFNVPDIDLIAFLRPTMSPSLYVQSAGRGTRWAAGKENCLVLDFARNVERLGPVDDPIVRQPKKKGEDEERAGLHPDDMKACPECHTYTKASSSFCGECGHVFERERPPPKHEATASDMPIMSADLVWHPVRRMSVAEYFSRAGNRSVRIGYLTSDGQWLSQYLAFDNPNARGFACRGWRSLGGSVPEPASIDEALGRRSELRPPAAIGVKKKGDFWNVERLRHADA